MCKIQKKIIVIVKRVDEVLLKFEGLSDADVLNLVDFVKSFPTNIYYLFANIGVDTAENEPLRNTCKF